MAVIIIWKLVVCRFERLSTTDLRLPCTCLVKPIKDLIPTWSSLSFIKKVRKLAKPSTRNCTMKWKVLSLTLTCDPRVLHQTAWSFSICFSKRVGETQHSFTEVHATSHWSGSKRILTFCLRHVEFIDWTWDFDWACDRQAALLCSLTRDNLKQINNKRGE